MRLNCVESFYAGGRPLARGRLSTAKAPLQRGGRLRPGSLQRAVARGHDRLQPARKGRLPAVSLQGGGRQRLPRKGQPAAASPAARRGASADRKGGRPSAGRLPTVTGNCCLRRGSRRSGVMRVKEGYGNFLRKRWLCPSKFRKSQLYPFYTKFLKCPQYFWKFQGLSSHLEYRKCPQ
ncbi:hypothetical protein BHE74_00011017 [Ensete ventricosum]|nr:hypothetical protein BHE74_00011017 [Ensete ventricosum]